MGFILIFVWIASFGLYIGHSAGFIVGEKHKGARPTNHGWWAIFYLSVIIGMYFIPWHKWGVI